MVFSFGFLSDHHGVCCQQKTSFLGSLVLIVCFLELLNERLQHPPVSERSRHTLSPKLWPLSDLDVKDGLTMFVAVHKPKQSLAYFAVHFA